MRNKHIPSTEGVQTGALPALRATISDHDELKKWREILYQSMTLKHSGAISRFLGEGAGMVRMMEILNKRTDKTKKSKWATLQAIIQYKKHSRNKAAITAGDVRAELESIDRDFGSRRTVTEIIQIIQERADAAQLAENNALTTTLVAGFETPIIGSVRATITDLLQESQNKQETPEPETTTVTSTLTQNIESIAQPVSPLPTPPRHIKTVQHRTEPKHIRPLQQKSEIQKPLSVQKSNDEILVEHRDFLIKDINAGKIILDAWRKSHRNNKLDDLIFEGFIRSKESEILTTLKAIKRIGQYKNWKIVCEYVFGDDFFALGNPEESVPGNQTETVPAPETQTHTIKTSTPPRPVSPIPKKQPIPTPPTEMIREPESYEILAVQILENPEWMTLLHSLCQLHMKRKYADFVEQWSAFKENEDDDMQIDLWNILSECSQAKARETQQASHSINIAFELCGYTFSPADKELYTKRYSQKKRAPELWKNNDDYEKLLLDLEDIHSYTDLSSRTKNILVRIPDKKEWYMYEEQICPIRSLDAYVQHELSRQFSSGAKKGQEFQYLREAKKIIRQLSRK